MFYVQVGDIDAKLAQIEQLGGRRCFPYHCAGRPDDRQFADPEGHVVGLDPADSLGSRGWPHWTTRRPTSSRR
jgi:hypothetical protein